MDNKQNQQQCPTGYPVDPPPAYTEFYTSTSQMSQLPTDNNTTPYRPHFTPIQMPNSSINSSVIPILPPATHQQQPDQHSFVPNYGSVNTVILVNDQTRPLLPSENFLCPVCGIGLLEREFTLLGLLLAIFLFPFGLLCLFVLRKWRCGVCGTSLGY